MNMQTNKDHTKRASFPNRQSSEHPTATLSKSSSSSKKGVYASLPANDRVQVCCISREVDAILRKGLKVFVTGGRVNGRIALGLAHLQARRAGKHMCNCMGQGAHGPASADKGCVSNASWPKDTMHTVVLSKAGACTRTHGRAQT